MVCDYIMSAEPVGSAQVARKKGIEISSATVRTVMAELEERGFLKRSHASSGRVPTPSGYQFYVDQLMRLRPLTPQEREEIRKRVETGVDDMNEVLRDACRLVSNRSHQPGFALSPNPDDRSLKHVQFIALKEKLVLAVLVSGSGIVENKILKIDRAISQEELNRMHNYLNERLAGLTLANVRKEILLEMKRIQRQYDQILGRALTLAEQAFSDSTPGVHIEGGNLLLQEPEFTNFDRMQQILRTLEEKTFLIRLLDQSLASPGVKIAIGGEHQFPEINGLTMITSDYSDSEGNRGVLGVIGPTRLDYARIVPLVDFTSRILTEVLQEKKES